MKFTLTDDVRKTVGSLLFARAQQQHTIMMAYVELAKKFGDNVLELHIKQPELLTIQELLERAMRLADENKANTQDLEARVKLDGLKAKLEAARTLFTEKSDG